jgi:hypothetical protein
VEVRLDGMRLAAGREQVAMKGAGYGACLHPSTLSSLTIRLVIILSTRVTVLSRRVSVATMPPA